ncbi:MAG: Ni/Fe hydrogenase subunit alpha [Chitinispirillaceae bacterium]|nr:Ni/Fe hydrogenase subunit alpha [Chitinispirillaceae bacterium]
MEKIKILEPVTRIEGHAKITLECNDNGDVIKGHLNVLELRGFEKLVEGMELLKMPLITGRICGVCPAAHHLASVIAIENGSKTKIPEEAKILRELLYLGHILHSHALSCFVLIGPDLLFDKGAEQKNIFNLLTTNPETAKKALRLRSIGQKIVEKIGGRGIHPVTAVAGGISSAPSDEDLKNFQSLGDEALKILDELYKIIVEKLSKLEQLRTITAFDNSIKMVALSCEDNISFLDGKAIISDISGKQIDSFTADNYAQKLVEHIMPASYMKSVKLKNGDSFIVGALPRLLVNKKFSTPKANNLLENFKKKVSNKPSAFDYIEARFIEMIYCAEKIIELCKVISHKDKLNVPVSIEAGVYRGMVEAPRGILIHDYTADENGHVKNANLIVATQNNYNAIDSTITAMAKKYLSSSEKELFDSMEFAVRCFDPCLSCATHAAGRMAMQIEILRNGIIENTLTRGE